jgi:septal ring factor EnvC (AmiA/AmiB activator)
MSQYKMEIAGRDRAREQLTSMQMRPEEIAKLQKEDPENLSRLRDRAKQLQDTANQYDMRAQDTWAKYAETDQGKEAVAKARASADAEKAAGAPVKAELSTDKEIRVRVTNPKEVGAQPPGAPAPGYLPRP